MASDQSLAVPCPTCHAPVGHGCRRQNPGSQDSPLKRVHPARATIASLTVERDDLLQRLAAADFDRARAVETRENANAATLRAEVERDALKAERDAALAREDSYRGERDVLRVRLDKARDEAREAESERDEAIRERDAALREVASLRGSFAAALEERIVGERCDAYGEGFEAGKRADGTVARQDVDTLLEAIRRVGDYVAGGGENIRAGGAVRALLDCADEIAKRTGYAGGQDDG